MRWAHLVKPGGSVLDVAGGFGRHSKLFFERNHPTAMVDRASDAIEYVASAHPGIRCVQADIETADWPLLRADGSPEQFDALIATNYLWRPLFPTLMASLAPGGVLIYETFAVGNETVGKPSRPDFLLRDGELLDVCKGLRIVAYEHGFLSDPARYAQRIVAIGATEALSRHPL
jgi:SAM-dependent methyltransferase